LIPALQTLPSWRPEGATVGWISSEDAFAAWAPDRALWSPWAKPIAFVHADGGIDADAVDQARLPALAWDLDSASVVIVDLPGADAVYAGLSLVARGFRPIPLFNGTSGPSAVIDVAPITRALASGAEWLNRSTLGPDARPAFLLDARRSVGTSLPRPGSYDNRWLVLPQDFPSGSLLGSRGIRSATLIQRGSVSIADDLAHVLRRWHDSGIAIRVVDLASGRSEENVSVPKPSHFRLAWYAAIALLGLRRSNVGGFGSMIPEATQRSGFVG
jgi:hypothetical protein